MTQEEIYEYTTYRAAEAEVTRLGGDNNGGCNWRHARFYNRLAAQLFLNWLEKGPGWENRDINHTGDNWFSVAYR